MLLLLLLIIPIAAAAAVLAGAPARRTATVAAGASLAFGLVLATLWGAGNRDLGSLTIPVLSKPAISLSLGLYDGMSVIMMLLTVIVAFAAVCTGECKDEHARLWYSSTLLLAGGALGAFLSTDLFFFYAFHELALIPTFLMIGLFGRGDRRAIAWKITLYLAFGSIVLLAGLLWLVSASGAASLAFDDLLSRTIPLEAQRGISAFLLAGFGVLVSLFPFHSWAPPAYASAPAPIAMLHAGVLKKFGLYGLLRLMPLVPDGMHSWLEILLLLLLGNIIWMGFVTINQKRLDTLLGSSSVMHMGYIFLAVAALIAAGGASNNPLAKPAAVLLMFGHGISVALLFALADRIERAAGTLELRNLGGLAVTAPSLAFLFGLAAMASIGLPGLANFAGEILVFLAAFNNWNPSRGLDPVQIATICALWGVVISAVYMLRAYRDIFQGETSHATKSAADLGRAQKIPAFVLAAALVVAGLYPNSLLRFFHPSAPPPATTHSSLHTPPPDPSPP